VRNESLHKNDNNNVKSNARKISYTIKCKWLMAAPEKKRLKRGHRTPPYPGLRKKTDLINRGRGSTASDLREGLRMIAMA